jgi:hypothetical protein
MSNRKSPSGVFGEPPARRPASGSLRRSRRPPGRERGRLTSQGHARTVFRRALERGNLVVAELEARSVGRLDLREALELTALIAKNDDKRADSYGTRWLERWLAESPRELSEVALATAAVGALGGSRHAEAVDLLRSLTAPEARAMRCAECRVLADAEARGWRAYWADEPGTDDPPQAVFSVLAARRPKFDDEADAAEV